jgi:prepilin-type N-terminal cleavage/methylation domain-containing protein
MKITDKINSTTLKTGICGWPNPEYDPCSSQDRRTKPVRYPEAGFTIIEVMVVTAIVGILAAVAFSALMDQLPRSRTKAAARQLRADLQKAKLEAIKRNTESLVEFTLAAGLDSGSCITCIDDNSDDDCDTASDTIISELDFNEYEDVALSGADFSGAQVFVFNSRGVPEQLNGAMCAGTAVVNCTSDNNFSQDVIMSNTGRIRID